MSAAPRVGLVTAPDAVATPDPLQAALEAAGAGVGRLGWDPGADPAAALEAADAASYGVLVLRPPLGEAGHLADLQAWAAAAERTTRVANAADVLRWAAHRGHLTELASRGVPVLPTRVVPAASTDVLDQLAECPWEEVVVSSAVATGAPDEGGGDGPGAGSPPAALSGGRDDPAVLEHAALLAAGADVVVQPRGTAPRSLVIVGGSVVVQDGDDEGRSADVRAALAALQVAPGRVDLARVRLVDHDGIGVVAALDAVAPDLGSDARVLEALAAHLVGLARS